jgi:hypothetical protein
MTAGSYYNLITFNGQHPYMLKEAAKDLSDPCFKEFRAYILETNPLLHQ